MNWYISQSVQQDRGHRVLFPRINKDLIHCLSRRQSQGFSQCHLCYCRRVVGFLFILSTNLGCAKAWSLSVEGFRTWLACLLVCLSMYGSMLPFLFIQRRPTKGILWLRALFFVGGRVHAKYYDILELPLNFWNEASRELMPLSGEPSSALLPMFQTKYLIFRS